VARTGCEAGRMDAGIDAPRRATRRHLAHRGARRTDRLVLSAAGLVALAGAAFVGGAGAPAGASPAQPAVASAPHTVPNPPTNLAPPRLLEGSGPCVERGAGPVSCPSPCFAHGPGAPTPETAGCTRLGVEAIDEGRAMEHLRPIVLPDNYARLAVSQQLFVLVDLERVARGVPPLVGLAAPLDLAAQQGADHGEDPPVRTRYGAVSVAPVGNVYGIGGAWAGGTVNALATLQGWMYDDGWGGSRSTTVNLACTGATSPGCWGHRMELLGEYSGADCRTCVAGAGFDAPHLSYTVLIVRPARPARLVFGWDASVLPHLPAGYERVRAP